MSRWIMTTAAAFALLAVTGRASAEDVDIKKLYREAAEQQQAKRVADAEKELAALEEADTPTDEDEAKSHARKIRSAKRKVDREKAKTGDKLPPPEIEFGMKVGAVGFLPEKKAEVRKVISEDEARVQIYWTVTALQFGRVPTTRRMGRALFINGIDTENMKFRETIDLDQLFLITESRMIKGPGGGEMEFFVAEPQDIDLESLLADDAPADSDDDDDADGS